MELSILVSAGDEHLEETVSELMEKSGRDCDVQRMPHIPEPELYSPNGNVYRGEEAIIRYALSQSDLLC